jgi:hypothetical protein
MNMADPISPKPEIDRAELSVQQPSPSPISLSLFRAEAQALIDKLRRKVDSDIAPELAKELEQLIRVSGQYIEIASPARTSRRIDALAVVSNNLWLNIMDTPPFNQFIAPLLRAPNTLLATLYALKESSK